MASMDQVVIIGNGVAGITAARHIRKRSDRSITVISSETPHFFSRTALMYVYMGHMTFEHTKPYEDFFWKKNRIDLIFDHAERLDTESRTISLRSGRSVSYDQLIIASGSQSNFPGVPGEHLKGVQALYSYQDLRKMEDHTRGIANAVVVGGGLIGVEMAEMLRSRDIHVTMLVRESAFWNNVLPLQEATMISKHIASHGVDIRHERELQEIMSNAQGTVRSVRTNRGEEFPTEFVGIAVGVHPNVSWLQGSPIDIRRGILVNKFLETNVPGIYAIGDCAERTYSLEKRSNIEQVWYTARMMGEVVAQTICGEKTPYEPGPWFNSAKFFDIEFQTYGNVASKLPDEQDELYWEHPSGTRALHIVWQKDTGHFLGINSFGIRLRHQHFDRWLREKRTAQFVIDRLRDANFDPEFSESHEPAIRHAFTSK